MTLDDVHYSNKTPRPNTIAAPLQLVLLDLPVLTCILVGRDTTYTDTPCTYYNTLRDLLTAKTSGLSDLRVEVEQRVVWFTS